MRKIFWFAIVLIWLAVIGFIGYSYFHAPKKNVYYAVAGFVSIGRDYVEGRDVDLTKIQGNDNNAEYLTALGTLLQTLSSTERELGKQTSLLMVLIQPRNLSSNQSLDIGLQRTDDYIKLVSDSYTKSEAGYQKMSADMLKINRKNLKFDVVGLVDSVKTQQPHRQKKYAYYSGLAQYVKATIQFVKSRVGYYQISANGNSLTFTRPADQNYYNQLISGIGNYQKQIDKINDDDMNVVRNQVGQAESLLATFKK